MSLVDHMQIETEYKSLTIRLRTTEHRKDLEEKEESQQDREKLDEKFKNLTEGHHPVAKKTCTRQVLATTY